MVFFFFFLQGLREFGLFEDALWSLGAIPANIVEGKHLWTLLTSMFMHADIVHLFGNMLYLWVFGDNIEDALGHGKYLLFYLLGGLIASFAHIASLYATLPSIGEIGFQIPAVGASGAISAVLGAYLVLYPRARIRTLVFYFLITIVSVPALYYLGFWFFYQLLLGFVSLTGLSSGVAFWAHIGGFVFGVIAVKLLGGRARAAPLLREEAEMPTRPLIVAPRVRTPYIEVAREADRLRVLADLPGVEERDIKIDVSERTLGVRASRGEINYLGRIELPVPVAPRVYDYNFKNGVLSLYLLVKE